MCELFGLTGPDEIVVNEYLETFASHSVDHPNGWGIALFCGKEVNIEKEPVAAYRSSYLKERLRTPLRASNMMAHIRFATRGHMAYENCHPFVRHDASGRAWTFMHNGTIFNCPLLSKYLYTQSGQTDSERILLYMIDQINAEIEKQISCYMTGACCTSMITCEAVCSYTASSAHSCSLPRPSTVKNGSLSSPAASGHTKMAGTFFQERPTIMNTSKTLRT